VNRQTPQYSRWKTPELYTFCWRSRSLRWRPLEKSNQNISYTLFYFIFLNTYNPRRLRLPLLVVATTTLLVNSNELAFRPSADEIYRIYINLWLLMLENIFTAGSRFVTDEPLRIPSSPSVWLGVKTKQ
jgi:hypothetical protein